MTNKSLNVTLEIFNPTSEHRVGPLARGEELHPLFMAVEVRGRKVTPNE